MWPIPIENIWWYMTVPLFRNVQKRVNYFHLLLFIYILRQSLAMLFRLVLNSWAQVSPNLCPPAAICHLVWHYFKVFTSRFIMVDGSKKSFVVVVLI